MKCSNDIEIIDFLFALTSILELSLITSERDNEILENFLIEVSMHLKEPLKDQLQCKNETVHKLLNRCSELCKLVKNKNTKILIQECLNIQ